MWGTEVNRLNTDFAKGSTQLDLYAWEPVLLHSEHTEQRKFQASEYMVRYFNSACCDLLYFKFKQVFLLILFLSPNFFFLKGNFFDEFQMEGVAAEHNEIYLELTPENLSRALKTAQNAKTVKIKLTNKHCPCLTVAVELVRAEVLFDWPWGRCTRCSKQCAVP